ncbi:RHS repeat-associated core domain-containing protein [Chryseobacterium candidae]
MNHFKTGNAFFAQGSYKSNKYNSKELQETGMYSYGWREYMPDIGRWNGIDQLAESYLSASPYAYVLNNPINMFDPDGRKNEAWLSEAPLWLQEMWNATPDGTNSYWFNNGSGFTSYDGGPKGGGGSLAYSSNVSYGGSFTMGDGTYALPPIVLTGNKSGWADQFRDHMNKYARNTSMIAHMIKLGNYSDNIPSNKEITPWQLGVEWLSGTGPRHRDFTNGDLMTEMLRQHNHVQATRDIILSKMALSQSSLEGSNSYKLGGIKGVGLYLKDYSTLLTGGLTGNLAVTYLGSYNLEYTAAAYNKSVVVSFHVENSSTMQSASRPPVLGYLPIWQQTTGKLINEKFKTGWGSKTTQSFHWTEVLYLK